MLSPELSSIMLFAKDINQQFLSATLFCTTLLDNLSVLDLRELNITSI